MHAQQSTSNQIPGTRKRFSIGDRNADGPSVPYSVFLCMKDGHPVTGDQRFSPTLGEYLFTTTGESYDEVTAKILTGAESTFFQAFFNQAHTGCAQAIALGFQPRISKIREREDSHGRVVNVQVMNNMSAIRITRCVIGAHLSPSAMFSLAGQLAGTYAAPIDCGQRFVGELTFLAVHQEIERTIKDIFEDIVTDSRQSIEDRTLASTVRQELGERTDRWAMDETVFQAAIAAFEATPQGTGWSGSLPPNSRALF